LVLELVNGIVIFWHGADWDINLNTGFGYIHDKPKTEFSRGIFYLKAICHEPDRVPISGGSFMSSIDGKKVNKKTAGFDVF
jgi:hypothetical protein